MGILNKIEETKKDTWGEDTYSGEAVFFVGFMFFFLGCAVLALILGETGAFDTPYEELGIDGDELAIKYFLEQYPEYKECEIKYYPESFNYYEQVKINCNGQEESMNFKDYENLQPLEEYFIKQLKEKGVL